jgi:hypothetical protein
MGWQDRGLEWSATPKAELRLSRDFGGTARAFHDEISPGGRKKA